jgi:putative transposase
MRNLASKVPEDVWPEDVWPEDVWPEFKVRATACCQAASPALARLLRDDIRTTDRRDLPSAVARREDDVEAYIAHLKFPLGHRRAVRTTNLLERLFGEDYRKHQISHRNLRPLPAPTTGGRSRSFPRAQRSRLRKAGVR